MQCMILFTEAAVLMSGHLRVTLGKHLVIDDSLGCKWALIMPGHQKKESGVQEPQQIYLWSSRMA